MSKKRDLINELNTLLNHFNKNKIKNLKEWEKIESLSKKDLIHLKDNPPNNFVNCASTSGSTGEPLYVFYSKEAYRSYIERTIKSYETAGITDEDTVLNLFAYGTAVVGSEYERACIESDIPVYPLGAPNTFSRERAISLILRAKPTVWLSVPSYALNLLREIKKKDPEAIPRLVFVAGELLLDSYISEFESLGVKVVNQYGLTECPAVGISKPENPKVFKALEKGILLESEETEKGDGLLITDKRNKSTPIIRYKTKDLIENVKYDKNGFIKEFRVIGRYGSLVSLQGRLFSKVEIKDTLSRFTKDFFVEIKTRNNRDFVDVHLPKNLERKKDEIRSSIEFITAKINLSFKEEVTALKTPSNKKKYVIDLRK